MISTFSIQCEINYELHKILAFVLLEQKTMIGTFVNLATTYF